MMPSGAFALFISIFKLGFWLFLLAVAGRFIFALLCATIEAIRDDRRRAARMAAEAASDAPSMWERTI